MTDLVIGLARVPGQILRIVSRSQSQNLPKDYRGREWAMSHFAECLSNQQNRRDSQPATDTNGLAQSSADIHESTRDTSSRDQTLHSATDEPPREHQAPPIFDSGSIHNKVSMKEGNTKAPYKGYGHVKHALSETKYRVAKSAKYALNFLLVLPTDFTLSLSKGFHNAPKLYGDKTVESIPKVIGIKSGFRAAGKVSDRA